MNIKRYLITLITLLVLTTALGTALASPETTSGSNSDLGGRSISTAAEKIDLNEAEILMDHIDLHLPSVLPDNFEQESVIYSTPPEIINKALRTLNEDSVKEVTIRYRDHTEPSNWIDYTTKKMEIDLVDKNVKSIEINGVTGQYLESEEKGIKVFNWHFDGASHFVIATSGIDQSQLWDFVNSIK
ncbi:hypothetical protein J41TS12_32550 [Paenibacillus antibioticophila]|uniref:DUF4367 domain-containing protein n=1 Tax=Paenibacillus antibioticophila TaxID=1274374 RepID=A0A920CIJ6_9BACL|nr:hypothetical protein [Paenibacillus antibioticophila]GIO38394.1 hypothetical protein J41TS12_32550 [Paenibacillus antibioticophila]